MDKLAVLFVMLAVVLAAGNLVDGRAPPPVLPAGPSPPANITSSAPAVQRPPPPVLPAGPSPPANITSSAPTVQRPPPPVLAAGPSPPANITSSAPAVHRPPPPVLPASKLEDKLNDKLKRQTKKNKLAEAGDIALGVLSIVAGVVVVWLKMRPARAPAPPHQQHPAIVPAPQQQEEHPAPQQQVVNNSLTISIGNK